MVHARRTSRPGRTGVCYSQQPERRNVALRVRGNVLDFDAHPDALLSNDPLCTET